MEGLPGVLASELGEAERLIVACFRLISIGKGHCPALLHGMKSELGASAQLAHDGLSTTVFLLPDESCRRLTLGEPCFPGITWDEAAILALLESAQRSDPDQIGKWFRRLGVFRPSSMVQKGIARTAAAFAVSGQVLASEIADLTLAKPLRTSPNPK